MRDTPDSLTEADIRRLVDRFYARVRQDPLLAPVFNSKIPEGHWPKHINHIQDFWSSVFLKTGRFSGNPLAKHAQIAGLTPELFSHWLALFEDTAETVLSPPIAAEFVIMANRIGSSLQMGLAFHHEQSGQEDSPFKRFGLQRPVS